MGRTQCAYDFPRSRGKVVSRMERLGARSKTAYREAELTDSIQPRQLLVSRVTGHVVFDPISLVRFRRLSGINWHNCIIFRLNFGNPRGLRTMQACIGPETEHPVNNKSHKRKFPATNKPDL